jgi:hypothetical protein
MLRIIHIIILFIDNNFRQFGHAPSKIYICVYEHAVGILKKKSKPELYLQYM